MFTKHYQGRVISSGLVSPLWFAIAKNLPLYLDGRSRELAEQVGRRLIAKGSGFFTSIRRTAVSAVSI
jgi:hypothetical protein